MSSICNVIVFVIVSVLVIVVAIDNNNKVYDAQIIKVNGGGDGGGDDHESYSYNDDAAAGGVNITTSSAYLVGFDVYDYIQIESSTTTSEKKSLKQCQYRLENILQQVSSSDDEEERFLELSHSLILQYNITDYVTYTFKYATNKTRQVIRNNIMYNYTIFANYHVIYDIPTESLLVLEDFYTTYNNTDDDDNNINNADAEQQQQDQNVRHTNRKHTCHAWLYQRPKSLQKISYMSFEETFWIVYQINTRSFYNNRQYNFKQFMNVFYENASSSNNNDNTKVDVHNIASKYTTVMLLNVTTTTDEEDEEDDDIIGKKNYEHFLKYSCNSEKHVKFNDMLSNISSLIYYSNKCNVTVLDILYTVFLCCICVSLAIACIILEILANY